MKRRSARHAAIDADIQSLMQLAMRPMPEQGGPIVGMAATLLAAKMFSMNEQARMNAWDENQDSEEQNSDE